MEIRGVTWQVLSGIAYSLVLAPLTCFMLASKYRTYNVPLLTVDPKNVSYLPRIATGKELKKRMHARTH